MCEGLKSVLKPPSRSGPASSPVSLLGDTPVPGRLFLTFLIKSGKSGTGKSGIQQ